MENPQIYKAVSAIMADMRAVGKNDRNVDQDYPFRGIDSVVNALHPLLAKYGVFIVPKVLTADHAERPSKRGGVLLCTRLTVQYTMYAEDGSSVSGVAAGEAMDSSDKACSKAMTFAFKSFLIQTFCLTTEDMTDADSESPQPAPQSEKPEAEKLKDELAEAFNSDPLGGGAVAGTKQPAHIERLTMAILQYSISDETVAGWLKYYAVKTITDLTAGEADAIVTTADRKYGRKV